MFQQSADAIWSNKIAAYPNKGSSLKLAGSVETVETHVELSVPSNEEGKHVIISGFNCEVDMEHDGYDWMIVGVEYRSEFGGPSDDFDAPKLREMKPDGTFKDCIRREVLALLTCDRANLAKEATEQARARG